MNLALDFNGATKRFGSTVAVDDLSLQVDDGSFLGLLGRNGAGKTTTINMATGVLRPTAGRLHVLGLDIVTSSLEVRRQIGVMPQEDASFDLLTATQYLRFVGGVYGLGDDEVDARSRELFDLLDLSPEPGTPIRDFSWGMKKKVALSAAIIHSPRLVFLDEPFEGIDPVTSRTIKGLLGNLHRRGVTIVMSSHVLDVVEKLCPRIAIIEKGRLVAEGSPEELRKTHDDASTLEDLFVRLAGGAKEGDLSWL